jgi:hypothetical protein
MKNTLVIKAIVVLLFCGGPVFAEFDFTISNTYNPNLLTLNDQSLLVNGAGVHDVWAYGNSYIEIHNTTPYEWKVGGVGRALLFDNSSINVYGGDTGNITSKNNSSLNIYGGEVGGLIIMENSSATLYGGNIGSIRNSQFVAIGTAINLNIVVKSWAWNQPTNHITGIWDNDSSFDISLIDTSWADREPYRMIDHISFTVVPEPATSTLLLMSGVLLLRRRR